LQNIPQYERSASAQAGSHAANFDRDGFVVLSDGFPGDQIDNAVSEFRAIAGKDTEAKSLASQRRYT